MRGLISNDEKYKDHLIPKRTFRVNKFSSNLYSLWNKDL